MKLTPLDIRKQEFRKTLRGFDPVEVQTFLDMVGEEYEQLLESNKQLNNRLIELETKLKDYQESEKNLRETLLNVQEVKKQSEESSRKQADLVIKESCFWSIFSRSIVFKNFSFNGSYINKHTVALMCA